MAADPQANKHSKSVLSSGLGEITTGISKLGGGFKMFVQSVRGFVSNDEVSKYYAIKETLGAGVYLISCVCGVSESSFCIFFSPCSSSLSPRHSVVIP
jgi:hypothetical protein